MENSVLNSARKALKVSAAAIVATALSVGGALAQSQGITSTLSNPREMMLNFDPENLGPLLTELGHVWEQKTLSDGRVVLAANINGQLGVTFVPSACLDQGKRNCVGLNSFVHFADVAANPQSVSAFNQKYWFASAGIVGGNNGVYISRYEIADFGIPRGNVDSSISSFAVLALKFIKEIQTSGKTVSLDGYADDLSSNYLNKEGIKQISGYSVVDHREFHMDGFEAAPEIVKVLINTPDLPKNKIQNVTRK